MNENPISWADADGSRTVSGPFALDNFLNKMAVMPFFRDLKQDYSILCDTVLKSWQDDYGEFNSDDNLRRLLKLNQDDEKIILAKKHEQELLDCAHKIRLPFGVLFRGTLTENADVEDLTATSLSCNIGLKYGLPLMVIIVPQKIVHGLVINSEGENINDHDLEILLIKPQSFMTEYSSAMKEEILKHIQHMFGGRTFNIEKKGIDSVMRNIKFYRYAHS